VKRVEAIIVPAKIDDVKEELSAAGVMGMTVAEVRSVGKATARFEVYHGAPYTVDFTAGLKIVVVVCDALVPVVLEVLASTAAAGRIGDGYAHVSEIVEAVRIRTGERGEEAI
jgi:nitrogen regulatory protein PII